MVGFRELTGWWAYGGTRRVVCLERAWKLTPTPYLVLCVSSIWLLLSYILYKKLVNSFLSSVSHSSKLSTFYFLFYWSIVHLQCCVNFYYTSKWFSYTYICIYIFFHVLFHYGLSQDIEYSSLCYTEGPYCLSISVYTSLHPLILNSLYYHLPPPSPLATTSLFSMSLILFLFHR